MRPGQQNKRGRGRGNNNNNNNNNNSNSNSNNGGNGNNFNRKGSNPLTRTYDSSGPDVKIRGTAQHIAEKYATLARDAQSAGDRVMAENYLQHAEHYNRIIAAAQAQMQERFQRDDRNEYNDRDSDDVDSDNEEQSVAVVAPPPAPQPIVIDGTGPQPIIEGTPAEVAIDEETAAEAPRSPSRRRGTTPRPRRQPRRNADSEEQPQDGDGAGGTDDAAPALAAADTE